MPCQPDARPGRRLAAVAAVLAAVTLYGCTGGLDPATPPAVASFLPPTASEPAPAPDPIAPSPKAAPEPLVPLRAEADFPVGVAVRSRLLQSDRYREVAGTVFSSLTASYEMKMRPVASGPDSYHWHAVDTLVEFAEANQMQVHGHALVWHESTPAWLDNFSGGDEEFEAVVRDYIAAIVGRYQGRVTSWDVVNEALEPNTGRLRDTVFRRRMGDDYVARLFEYARAADPNALLFYNEFGTTWDDAKLAAMLAMIDDFQRRGVPIDGVGLQLHVTSSFPDVERIAAAMDAVADRGLLVHISELDVRVNPDGDLTEITRERSQAQQRRVREIVAAFLALPPGNRFAITVWGLRDGDSWLIDRWGNPEWPLLFDDDLEPKPAYFGFLEAL